MNSETVSGLIGAGGNAAGALLGQVGQYFLNRQEFNLQKQLFDYQNDYNNPSKQVERLLAAGATPSAAVQGVVGSSPNQSIPSVVSSHSGLPIPLGSAFHEGKLKASEFLQKNTEREAIIQQMDFNPRIWKSQIDEALSRIAFNVKHGNMMASQMHYYDEFAETLMDKRPWEVASLQEGLKHLSAQISELYSRSFKNREEAATEPYKRGYYSAVANESWQRGLNLSYEGFALMFDNQLRSIGFNPNKPFWDNILRLSFTRPNVGIEYLDNFGEMLSVLDGRLKVQLGDNYKRNIAIGYGLYRAKEYLDRKKDQRINRLDHVTNIISKFIPFTSPSSKQPYYYGGRSSW